MAVLAPFRALRPAPAAAAAVAAVPYDVVDTAEARALARDNPLSFLHVSRAEIDLPDDVDPHSDRVYALARDNFAHLRAIAPLVVDDEACVYVYRLRMGAHVQTGLAAGYAADEYESGAIRKHEHTRRDKEDDRARHVLELRAQTGPVFLTYRASRAVNAVVQEVVQAAPLYDFAAADGVQHTLWPASSGQTRRLVEAFVPVPALYIADGHHRAASAVRARRALAGAHGATGEWDRILAVAFPDDEVAIQSYNRLVADLAGMTAESFLAELARRFPLSPGPPAPARRGEVSVFAGSGWQTLALADPPAGAAPDERLDVSRLQATVLAPLLHIGDPRSDTRIHFLGGARGTAALEERVRSGAAAVAFSLHPVDVGDLMAIADAGGIMPPKSTWFEPKLRDGLLIHLI